MDATRVSDGFSDRAAALFRDAIVCDMTLPWAAGNEQPDVTLPRWQAAGYDLVSLSVPFSGVHSGVLAQEGSAFASIAILRRQIRERSDRLLLAESMEDILAAKESGKLAIILNFQETAPFEGRVELVELFYELGVRHALLAYNVRNAAADGCAEKNDGGLSRYGCRLVQEMNRVGMLVDGTHCSYRTTMDAMEISTSPFIFSHSNAAQVHSHFRNIRDDQIEACARSGGVIGVNGIGRFLGEAAASSESFFRHVDHIATLVGARHVGIGLDFVTDEEGVWRWVLAHPDMWPESPGGEQDRTRYAQPEQLIEVVELMLRHGYSDTDIRGFLGENFLRVGRQTWRPARSEASGKVRDNDRMPQITGGRAL